MAADSGPLYELSFRVEPDAVDDFQDWLTGLVTRAREQSGIVDVRTFEGGRAVEAPSRWTCQFHCADDAAFDAAQEDFFAPLEDALEQQFGPAVVVSARLLREAPSPELPVVDIPNCLNCGARLRGQYCGLCGQRARSRLISLWELISDAFGDLLEIDSRLWRTVTPLLRRPGRLTRDYLEGRRARYMPPFRTYLVLSVLFFVVAFFDPRDDLSLLFEPEPEPTPEEQAEQAAEAAQAGQEILDELAAEGIIVGGTDVEDADEEAPADSEPDGEAAAVEPAADDDEGAGDGFNIQFDEETGTCDVQARDLEDLPDWFKRRFTPKRIKEVCENVTADGGKSFGDLLLDNLPVALIVLLPLMALVLKILYPLSRRFFVEHLLFVIHYHAFFFLILILQILFARFAALIRTPEWFATLAIVAVSFYIPVYLYIAMRRVYGQGRFVTFVKYVVLVVAYSLGTGMTMLGAVLFALVSVGNS